MTAVPTPPHRKPHTLFSRAIPAARIIHPDGAPNRLSWRDAGAYTGAGLSYRGQQPRSFATLTHRRDSNGAVK